MRCLLICCGIVICSVFAVAAQPPQKSKLSAKTIAKHLETPIEVEGFRMPMKLREGLKLLYDDLSAKKKPVSYRFDTDAFGAENPDAPDIFETAVHIDTKDKRLPAAKVLSMMLDLVPTKNATYVVRDGYIEITTHKRARGKVM
jgi:hypothetical protein